MAISSQAIAAGQAFVSLLLDDQQFSESLTDWESNLRSLGRRMASFGNNMAVLAGPVAGVFSVGVRNLMTYSNQLALMESRLGIAGEELGQLAAMARLTGTSMDALEIGLKTIGERLVQLQSGGEEVTTAFELARINLEDFLAASEGDRFTMIAEGIASIEDAQAQAGVGLRILGEAGNRLLPLINLIGEMGAEDARALVQGITPTQRQIDAARQLDIQWQFLRISLANATAEMAANLLPVMSELLLRGIQFSTWLADFSRGNEELVASLGLVSFGMLGLAAVMRAFQPLVTPLIALAGNLRPLGVAMVNLVNQFRGFSGGLVEVQTSLGQVGSRITWLFRWTLILTGAVETLAMSYRFLNSVLSDTRSWLVSVTDAILESDLIEMSLQSLPGAQLGADFLTDYLRSLLPEEQQFSLAEVRSAPPAGEIAAAGTPASLSAVGIAGQFASAQTLDFAGIDAQRQQAFDIANISQNTEISKDHLKQISAALKRLQGMN